MIVVGPAVTMGLDVLGMARVIPGVAVRADLMRVTIIGVAMSSLAGCEGMGMDCVRG